MKPGNGHGGMGLAIAAIVTVLGSGCPSTPPPRPPTVILIVLDTVRASALSSYGASVAVTPALNRLADRGTVYENAFTPFPHTVPAHTALFTGRWPWHAGVMGIVPLPDRELTLAERMRGAGYRTAAFVSGWTVTRTYGFAAGFDHFDDTLAGCGDRRSAASTTAALRAWLATAPLDRPLFLWLHYFDAHAPYAEVPASESEFVSGYDTAPGSAPYPGQFVPPFLTKWLHRFPSLAAAAATYADGIRQDDAALGEALDLLADHGLTAEALIIITADHGEGLGEHGYYFDHGERLYQEQVHIPLVVVDPRVPGGNRIADPVALVDLYPTILERCGLAGEAAWFDGRPLPRQARPAMARILPLVCGTYRPLMSYPTELRGEASRGRALTDGRWKYLRYAGRDPELYDLAADPEEKMNLAGRGLPVENELRPVLESWAARATAPTVPTPLDSGAVRHLRSLGYLQ